eukprot:5325826-Prymnesium_polylepis.1
MLALQGLAEEQRQDKGEIDPELDSIADDLEEYLDDEVLGPGAEDALRARSQLLVASVEEAVPPPPPALDRMSAAQEARLLSAAVARLGGGDVSHGVRPDAKALRLGLERLLGGLSGAELAELRGQVGGGSAPPTPAATAADGG